MALFELRTYTLYSGKMDLQPIVFGAAFIIKQNTRTAVINNKNVNVAIVVIICECCSAPDIFVSDYLTANRGDVVESFFRAAIPEK